MFFFRRTALLATAVAGLGILSAVSPATAQIINGGFESGLTGWTVSTGGQADTVGTVQGVAPQQGTSQARLRSGGSTGGATPKATLDALIGGGTDLNTIRPSVAGVVTQGTVIQQTFNAGAGDILSLRYNFLTAENLNQPENNDFSFVHLTSLERLAAVDADDFPLDTDPGIALVGFDDIYVRQQDDGYATFTAILPTTGTYTLSLGVVDVLDQAVSSALLVDNVTLTASAAAAPEPGALVLMAVGLLPLAGVVTRRIRRRK